MSCEFLSLISFILHTYSISVLGNRIFHILHPLPLKKKPKKIKKKEKIDTDESYGGADIVLTLTTLQSTRQNNFGICQNSWVHKENWEEILEDAFYIKTSA